MKIRIQDSSVRFRITLKELEELQAAGRLESRTKSVDPAACNVDGVFVYGVSIEPDRVESHCQLDAGRIWLALCPADAEVLNDPHEEGIYLRREAQGHRFMAFIEKDRPASSCDKPEAWVYQQVPGTPPETRPIKQQSE